MLDGLDIFKQRARTLKDKIITYKYLSICYLSFI